MNDDRDLASLLADPPHVDDAGFTDRVVRALPPPRRRSSRLVYALVPSFGAAGCAAAFALSGRAPASLAIVVAFFAMALASSIVTAVEA